MSVIIMLCDYNMGAVIVSDSRETSPCGYNDKRQKIYQNENIIIGQAGLNSSIINGQKIEFGNLIVDELLKGNTIEEATSQNVLGKKLIEIIPNNQSITIFYAKKDGEVGLYDIKKDNKPVNLALINNADVFRIIPETLKDVYENYFYPYFIRNFYYEKIEDLEEMLKLVIDSLVELEQKKEKIFHIKSAIGGKTQIASIKFENK